MTDFVKVDGWSNPRHVGFRLSDQRLVIEVKISACRECEPCAARFEQVKDRIEELGMGDDAQWELENTHLSLPMPAIETKEEKLEFLEKIFGAPVRFVTWTEV